MNRYWRLLPFLGFILLAGFLWRGLSLNPQALPSTQIGKALPAFKLPMLGQGSESVFASSLLKNHVTLLNVWASWCQACTEEQVFLLKLARQGVQIYGLNYKDSTEDATHWLKEWGNPYVAIGEDHLGRVGVDLGVYGAPETFLIDKQGVIQHRYAGILNETVWQKEFVPLLKKLQAQDER